MTLPSFAILFAIRHPFIVIAAAIVVVGIMETPR